MKSKILVALAISAAAVSNAYAGTPVTIKVKNATTAEATYGAEYFSGSVSPTPGSIAPGATATFVLNSSSNIVSGLRFNYTSGGKQCRFAASHTVNVSNNVPTFNKSGTSYGITNASCTANITATQISTPWAYTVEFQIK